jgi:spermidine synthase
MKSRAGAVESIALLIFAFSGCAGLIYQSIWTQYLGLFLGHAAYAQSLVLVIFMGGMALGAWWTSVSAIQWRNLLRAYAWIELAIGLAAVAFHPVYIAATQFAYTHAFPALAGGISASILRWLLAAVLIFPQAVLLGATFPLMSNGLMRRLRDGNGAILSGLYFTNSIGAAAGALIATFVLLPAMGLPGAMLFGAVLNIVVAATAFVLSRQSAQAAPAQTALSAADATNLPAATGARLLLTAAFVTGATSFAYEIGWVRMLSLALGSTVHVFELMLAAFIGGLAFGGLWIRKRIDHYREPVRVGGYVQVLMGLAVLLSLLLYDHSFDWVAWFMTALSRTNSGYILFNIVTASIAIVIMAPPAFFAGMTLPLFTVALIRRSGSEASVGRIYAANTLGAIAGVLLMVHLLMITIGLKLSMVTAAAGDLVLGIFLLRKVLEPQQFRRYIATVAICVVALAATVNFARFDPLAMAAGVYRGGKARFDPASARVIFYRDGKTSSVAAIATAEGNVAIATNGKSDAAIQLSPERPAAPDEFTMVTLGLLPLATHADPRTAAVIGFGSGLTTHTLLGDSRLQRVDTIEIEPSMYEGARVFGERVQRAYRDPRSHIYFDDAKAYFAANQSRYDIIVSEPSNPWVSGVASLFTREFYQFVPRHLNPGGVFVQWVQIYEINDELIGAVTRSLAESFTDFRVYVTANADLLIVAKADGMLGPLSDTVFHEPALTAELARVGLISAAELSVHQIGDRRSLMPLFNAASQRTNSDFNPILSLEAPRTRFTNSEARAAFEVSYADLPVREVLAGLPPLDPQLIAKDASFSGNQLAHQAADIAAVLRDNTPYADAPDASIAKVLGFVRTNVGLCHAAGDGSLEVDALVQVAGWTIPFLDAAHLNGAWSRPAWIGCTTQPDAVRGVLALLDALAQRNFSLVHTQAVALLHEHSKRLSPMAQDWILRAAMLAAIAEHNYEEVGKLEASLGGLAVPTATTYVQRVYLSAFASARIKERAALAVVH